MLEPNEGKLSRSVLRRGGESNLASLSRPVCSSVKPCEIGENLLSVSNPISRLQEKLIHVGALIRPPTLQRRQVSGLHPYAAVARSSPPMSPLSEPGCRSVGAVPRPTELQPLRVSRLPAHLQRPHRDPASPE